ncbi:MAG: Uma2 family endonuclease [Gammaproteobacteria bacterium]
MSRTQPRIPYTYADYKSLPESMDRRYELLGGELHLLPAPTIRHQRIAHRLELAMSQYVEPTGLGEILHSPIDVVFGEGAARDVAQPDIVFISRERARIVTETEIAGAPDLTVEILSPGTEERDRNYKKSLYARHGVREYWIVDPLGNAIEVYALAEQGYAEPRTFKAPVAFESGVLPALRLDLAAVFA